MKLIILYKIKQTSQQQLDLSILFLYLTINIIFIFPILHLLGTRTFYILQNINSLIKFNCMIICLIKNNKFIIVMHETIHFLNILDTKIKRRSDSAPKVTSIKDKIYQRKFMKFPYAKAINFSQAQYENFPQWLTEKEGFSQFMYKNYENKLMSIPKICQKKQRASDQKYFVYLFLGQIPTFKNLPSIVMDIILSNLTSCYLKAGEIVHSEQNLPQFMAVIFVGSVQYRTNKTIIVKQKNDVILNDSFHKRKHQTIICKQQTILLKLKNSVYNEIATKLRKQIEMKQRDQISDMLKSTFFTELHLKDKKARNFYNQCDLQFYFKGQIVEEAGKQVKNLSIIYKGQIQEENHIYIREHNKWPLPYRKWEVRAVYNSYEKINKMKPYDFFGDEQIITNSKFKSKYIATTWSIVYTLSTEKFTTLLSSQDIKRLKKYHTEHADFNYPQFEKKIRDKVRSQSQKKKIIQKAINTTYSHKTTFSPKRMSLISQFEKSMMDNTLKFNKKLAKGFFS